MSKKTTQTITEDYYDSPDAMNFYFEVWGGEDIHIGLYDDTDDIAIASNQTIQKMIECSKADFKKKNVIDFGSGFCGAARYLAEKYSCKVTALNLSAAQNKQAELLNEEVGLSDQIKVVHGSFEEVPTPDESFDIVWSQDAILHSSHKDQVMKEAFRVLRKDGIFVMTDPMQKPGVDRQHLKKVLDRIHLDSLGDWESYHHLAHQAGFKDFQFLDWSENLIRHYSRVHKLLEERGEELVKKISLEYIEGMKSGLKYWVEAGESGLLEWGLMKMTKPS